MKQLAFESVATTTEVFRPIHYLGSKLRLVPQILRIVGSVAQNGSVCDLFSGSGTVALALSRQHNVIAVDIQEYSRVICSALLLGNKDNVPIAASGYAKHSALFGTLREALSPLITYELECERRALSGDVSYLCDYLEHASLALFDRTGSPSATSELRSALQSAATMLEERKLDSSSSSLITRHFGGRYFSYSQAVALDALLESAHAHADATRDRAIAAVLSTASEIVNTIGKHFAQPIRPRDSSGTPKPNLLSRIARDRQLDPFRIYDEFVRRYDAASSRTRNHLVIRNDYSDFLRTFSGNISAIYADPPYTRDHYSRFYHVLETMCFRDEPEISISNLGGTQRNISRGLYRADRHQSPFCIISQAPTAFRRLFSEGRRFEAPLILSYSPFEKATAARPRLMAVPDIVRIAKDFFRSVDVHSAGEFSHSKLNLQERNAPMNARAELFVICRP